jgi:hypothetical protein
MTTKYTKEKAESYLDLLMQRDAAEAELLAIVDVDPVDLEASKAQAIAAVRAEIDALYLEKQAGTITREEYLERVAPWTQQLIPLLEQEEQIAGRNRMRRDRDNAAREVTRNEKRGQRDTVAAAMRGLL